MAKPVMVKCRATGVKGPRDKYFKAPNGWYFQSEETYKDWLKACEKAHEKKVVCVATGVKGSANDFYKAPNGKYFQNESVYQAWLEGRRKEKASQNKQKQYDKPGRTSESYKKLCDTIADFLGYERGGHQPMPTVVFRRLKELDFYSDEIIQQTFDENADAIQWAMQNKKFEGDLGKANYMMAIVRNKIAEVYRREKDKAKKTAKEESRPDFDTMFDLSNIGAVHKGNDVSSLLGGDDLWI